MNNSNRYGVESMARERQAEIQRHLRQSVELRKLQSNRPNPVPKIKRATIAATALSILGTLAFVVITHVR